MADRVRRFACCLSVFLWCVAPAEARQTITATTITTNTTWGPGGTPGDSEYYIQNTITISNGATLTVQSGTTLYFNSGTSLIIGGSSTAGSLNAIGTSVSPVVFTSDNALHGGWAGLDFRANSDLSGASSLLSFCVIKKGGTTTSSGAMIKATNTTGVTLLDCTIADNRNYAMDLTTAPITVLRCTFSDSIGTYPVAGIARDVGLLFPNNTFLPGADGKWNAILLKTGAWSQSATLAAPASQFCYITAGGDIAVEGSGSPILSVAPGTVIKFPSGRLLAGWNTTGGMLLKGVVLTSALDDTLGDTNGDGMSAGAPNQWGGLGIGGSSVGPTVIDSCTVRYAGSTAGIRVLDPITITRCLIEQNTGYGLSVEASTATAGNMYGNLIRDNSSYEVAAHAAAMAGLVPNNTVMASLDGKRNGYLLYTGAVPVTCTLPKPPAGFCYITNGGDWVVEGSGSPVMTVALGTLIKFASGRMLAAWNTAGGLVMKGVVLTSALDDTLGDTNGDGMSTGAPNQWGGLGIGSSSVGPTVIDSCIVRYAGNTAGVRVLDPITMTRCLIEQNTGLGLSAEFNSAAANNIHDNVIRNSSSYEVAAHAAAMAGLVPNNTVVASPDGKRNGYLLYTGAVPVTCTLPKPPTGFCYITNGGDWVVEGAADPIMTIEPGTVLKFPTGARLLVGWNTNGGLVAKGVTFTSSADDTVGDTAGDGISTGASGQWRSMGFGSPCLASTVITCSTIRYAGGTDFRGVYISGSGPRFAHSTISNHFGDGVYVTGSGVAPSIYGCTITGNSDAGIEVASNATPFLRQCNLSGNGTVGVRTNSTTALVDARLNWWGNASGPADASAGPPDQNAGTGAQVSDYVIYRPWLTAASVPECDLTVSVPNVQAYATPSFDSVELKWCVSGMNAEAMSIQRRREGGLWQSLGSGHWNEGCLGYVDRDVEPGARYEYQLLRPSGTGESLGWIPVVIPARPILALAGAVPNPARWRAHVAFTLPDEAPATLELFDLSGRRVAAEEVGPLGAGAHVVELGPGQHLAPGVYMVRLRRASTQLTRRFVLMR